VHIRRVTQIDADSARVAEADIQCLARICEHVLLAIDTPVPTSRGVSIDWQTGGWESKISLASGSSGRLTSTSEAVAPVL